MSLSLCEFPHRAGLLGQLNSITQSTKQYFIVFRHGEICKSLLSVIEWFVLIQVFTGCRPLSWFSSGTIVVDVRIGIITNDFLRILFNFSESLLLLLLNFNSGLLLDLNQTSTTYAIVGFLFLEGNIGVAIFFLTGKVVLENFY